MHKFVLPVFLLQMIVDTAVAAPSSILVGDNDGFGAGIPDGGDGSVISLFQQGDIFDRRKTDEAGSFNGA